MVSPSCPVRLPDGLSLSLPPLDTESGQAVEARWNQKTKPPGSLGELESLAVQLAQIQARPYPSLDRPALMVFAGDHGAARHGISAYPPEVTWQMVNNFLSGGAAICVLARELGCDLKVIDAGVHHAFEPHPGLISRKIGLGTASYLESAAMTQAECDQALLAGYQLAIDSPADCLMLGEMGIGNTASASLILHHLSGVPLAECVGPGTGLAGSGLARKLALLEQARDFHSIDPSSADPLTVLSTFGGFEVAMLTGCLLGAVLHRKVAVVDGFIVSAAALVAERLLPGVAQRLVFAHQSAEPAHVRMLSALGAQPLLHLGLRLGEGSGAALAWPLLKLSLALLDQMATFDGAGVSGAA